MTSSKTGGPAAIVAPAPPHPAAASRHGGPRSGPSIAGRHTLLVVAADHLLMEMFENKNGKDVRTMQMEYTRVKWVQDLPL